MDSTRVACGATNPLAALVQLRTNIDNEAASHTLWEALTTTAKPLSLKKTTLTCNKGHVPGSAWSGETMSL
ncbi:hypothetical protein HID58_084602 [Brassica napus]|uniref:Uncharacterized protein n=1 Tax=Brassica napus TaxID=3708 RepID=A0ABQ7XKE5_BRANA|nr:hypothetical protein HID58_084602 [Brassica napus]